MANIKSQKKRNITNEKARLRNRSIRAALKTAAKKVHAAVDAGDKATAIAVAQSACRELDRAVTKGVIHKNQAANRKSGLMKLANSADAAHGATVAPAPKKTAAKKPVEKKAPAKKAEEAEPTEKPKAKKAPAKKAAAEAEEKPKAKKATAKKAKAEEAEEVDEPTEDAEEPEEA